MSSSTVDPPAASNSSPVRWLRMTLNSSVGAKFAVAITGLLLVGFVLTHMLGNAQILIGLFDRELARDMLNGYAEHLRSPGPLLWAARIGLLFILLVHLGLALRLFVKNRDARPVRYEYERTLVATTASRYMWLTGGCAAFIIFHQSIHWLIDSALYDVRDARKESDHRESMALRRRTTISKTVKTAGEAARRL